MIRFFCRHPILYTLIGSYLMGAAFIIRVTGIASLPYFFASPFGLLALLIFGAVFMLSLVNAALLFTRPDNGFRDRALKILEPIGLTIGYYFFAMSLDIDLRFSPARFLLPPSGIVPAMVVTALGAVSVVGYLILRYWPCRFSLPLRRVTAVGVLVGIGLCGWLFIRMINTGIFFHLLYLGNCIVIGLRVIVDTVIRSRRETCGGTPSAEAN